MDRASFIGKQFETLREEIKETRGRQFKTLSFGLIVIPAANYLGQTLKIELVILVLPIFVLIVGLIYLSDNNALMRCGRYIRRHIESEFPDIVGWEEWLETEAPWNKRSVDAYLNIAFYLLFSIYYACSVFLAGKFLINKYGENGLIIATPVISIYTAIGVWFLIYFVWKLKSSTRAQGENPR